MHKNKEKMVVMVICLGMIQLRDEPEREREIKPLLVALLEEESFGIPLVDNNLLQLPHLSVLKFNYRNSMHRLFSRIYHLIHPLSHPFAMHIETANRFLKRKDTSMRIKIDGNDDDMGCIATPICPIVYGLLHNLILPIKINYILQNYDSCFENCTFIINNIDPNNVFVKYAGPTILRLMNDARLIGIDLSRSTVEIVTQKENIQEPKENEKKIEIEFEHLQHFSKNQAREGRSYSVYSDQAATTQRNKSSYLIMFGGKINMKNKNNNQNSNNIDENNYNYYTMMAKIFSKFETKYILTKDLWKFDFAHDVLSEIIPVSSDKMLPHGRWQHTDAIIDNQLWIIGGLFFDVSKFEFEIGSKQLTESCKLGFYLNQALRDIFKPYPQVDDRLMCYFDIESETWKRPQNYSDIPENGSIMYGHCCIVVNDKIFVFTQSEYHFELSIDILDNKRFENKQEQKQEQQEQLQHEQQQQSKVYFLLKFKAWYHNKSKRIILMSIDC